MNQMSGKNQEAEKLKKIDNICNQQNSYQTNEIFISEQAFDKPRVSKWSKFLTQDSDEDY